MSNNSSIVTFWHRWLSRKAHLPQHLPRLVLAQQYQPRFVRQCPTTQYYCQLLSLLDWEQLPTHLAVQRAGWRTIPLAAYIGAWLIKLDRQLPSFAALRRFLRDHPGLVWALGFPLVDDPTANHCFNVEAALPTQRTFSRKLGELPIEIMQTMLDGQVNWLTNQLGNRFGDTVSIDTKHILAWVKENNPKQYIKEGRLDKTQQPIGDPDCKLGCKRRRNQATPTAEGQPATKRVSVGEFYWGYASGVVATKVPDVGEFVLAELTQTFNNGDLSYFLPLMAQVEQRLGRRPKHGTADAAFDAFYVYDYFHGHGGFAAVPLRQMKHQPSFSDDGLPLCDATLPMPLVSTFVNRTGLVQHQRGRYGCPLLHPEPDGNVCPIDHAKWPTGGCKTTMPTADGARQRYLIDRDSDRFKMLYRQRTAVERIFSQAVALGIERPKLRNQRAIANINTLTYVLINLRAMHRLLL